MESGTFSKTLCFVRFLHCSSGLCLYHTAKNRPCQVFSIHMNMSFWNRPRRGNGLPRQGGAVPSGKNQTARPQCRRERKPMKRQTKNPKGCDCCLERSCQHGFWRSSGRGNGLPRQGGAVRPGKNQTARPQCRRERKPMKHNTKNRKGAAA